MRHNHTHIPGLVYDNFRAIAESRLRRHFSDRIANGEEITFPQFRNPDIFKLMLDRDNIDWTRAAQPAITEATLAAMFQIGVEANP